jgi:hypothetical protein
MWDGSGFHPCIAVMQSVSFKSSDQDQMD